VAALVADLRAEGKAEWSISTIVRHASRVFSHAQRRCDWHGPNPVPMLESGERPKPSQTQRRRIFTSSELAATLAAANEPFRLLFTLACVSGARLSELLGLVWADLNLADRAAAELTFTYQVDRAGRRVPLKTNESRRTIELPRQLAIVLLEHRAASAHSRNDSFVFCTRSGRALGQRNVLRELRRAMTAAVDERGRPAFPVLSQRDDAGKPVAAPRGSVPNFHSFRHTAASEAIAAGESVEEVSWQLGHRNSNVTRTVYVQEVKSVERTARRRARMERRLDALVAARYQQPFGQAGRAEF
jgi:integrase